MPEAATLFKEWSGYLKPEDIARVETAYHFSEAAHTGQFRASGDPYISHPLAVANLLAQATGDLTFTAGPGAARRSKPQSDAEREREIDQQLLAAGILPGDPSLYPDADADQT